MTNFDQALKVIFDHEGRLFTQDPFDPGGATKYGITIETLSAVLGHAATPDDVRKLTEGDATRIYRTRYWEALRLDLLPSYDLALVVFDQAVQCGPKAAVERLQKVLNLPVDGRMTGKTLAAAVAVPAPDFAAFEYVRESMKHYAKIVVNNPAQRRFLAGWCERLFSLLDELRLNKT